MAGIATAMVTFAPRSHNEIYYGEADGRMWRPGITATLAEKQVPVWVVGSTGFATNTEPHHVVFTSDGIAGRPAISDVVVFMAGIFGQGDDLRALAREEGLLVEKSRERWWITPRLMPEVTPEQDAEFEDMELLPEATYPSQRLFEAAIAHAARECRVTVLAYPGSLLEAEGAVKWLREHGIDTDEFGLIAAGGPGADDGTQESIA